MCDCRLIWPDSQNMELCCGLVCQIGQFRKYKHAAQFSVSTSRGIGTHAFLAILDFGSNRFWRLLGDVLVFSGDWKLPR